MADFTPDFRPRSAYPEVAAAEDAIQAGDWPAFRARYDAATDWRGRQYIMGAADEMSGSEKFLKTVIERDPEDLVATTMYAARLVRIGWEIRTGHFARYVSAAQFEAFHKHLREAEQILIWVCARDPSFVPAWAERVTIARGLGLGQAETRRRYDHVTRHDPHNLVAQRSLLQELCPKWHGSLPVMHAFAAECAAAAPPGAPNAALVVAGHLEHCLGESTRKIKEHFAIPAVRQEIMAAAERSVLHPSFDRGFGWVYAMSMFALAFSLLEEWALAKRCFLELGPCASEAGWEYLDNNTAAVFVRNRARALERG
ncbi:MAG: hypothetical protein IRY85_16015 [Micromonosporaceae bacterium]|nr:hypothetical protein [Micromonosporaceae bacterium]